jgi:hypothetical protein
VRDLRYLRWDGFMWHHILSKFHEDWYRCSSNIEVLSRKPERLQCWYYWCEGFTVSTLRWLHVTPYTKQVSW